jgi:hypothetical protein
MNLIPTQRDIDYAMKISEAVEAAAESARCKLSVRQIMLLRGQLCVWLPKMADDVRKNPNPQ